MQSVTLLVSLQQGVSPSPTLVINQCDPLRPIQLVKPGGVSGKAREAFGQLAPRAKEDSSSLARNGSGTSRAH